MPLVPNVASTITSELCNPLSLLRLLELLMISFSRLLLLSSHTQTPQSSVEKTSNGRLPGGKLSWQ
jgi:hypothetical protein